MEDTRWNNPDHVPLSNGPLTQATPPAVPTARFQEDGQLIEFLLPFPMHVVDPNPWPLLAVPLNKQTLFIHKPVLIGQRLEAPERLGNEAPDVFCSIIRVSSTSASAPAGPPSPAEAWQMIEQLLSWIRVKARHYWLLSGQDGFGSLFRGTVFTQKGVDVAQHNIAVYGRTIIVKPIDAELWLTLSEELGHQIAPPVSEALFCDALLSWVSGDEVKAVLEMGVAAEVEISTLLGDVANSPPSTADKTEYLKKGDRRSFYQKLSDWPQRLGLKAVEKFAMQGLYRDWVDVVKELYELRGSVAHSGTLRAGVTHKSAAEYLFAANALFAYSREQRRGATLPIYSYPDARAPYNQIVIVREGQFSAVTSSTIARFS